MLRKDYWRYVKNFDFIGLCETWLEEKGWDRIKDKLPDTHVWKGFHAKKFKTKGRAKGGILIGKRKGWGQEEGINNTVEIKEGIILTRIEDKEMNWNICTVYHVGKGKESDLEETLMKITENYETEGIIIGGDFNIRTGELCKIRDDNIEVGRKSKDKIISNGGKGLVDMVYGKGWYILNGCTEGDWEG